MGSAGMLGPAHKAIPGHRTLQPRSPAVSGQSGDAHPGTQSHSQAFGASALPAALPRPALPAPPPGAGAGPCRGSPGAAPLLSHSGRAGPGPAWRLPAAAGRIPPCPASLLLLLLLPSFRPSFPPWPPSPRPPAVPPRDAVEQQPRGRGAGGDAQPGSVHAGAAALPRRWRSRFVGARPAPGPPLGPRGRRVTHGGAGVVRRGRRDSAPQRPRSWRRGRPGPGRPGAARGGRAWPGVPGPAPGAHRGQRFC